MYVPLSRSLVVASLVGVAALMSARPAAALECKSDQDCPQGFECQKAMSAPGCSTPPDCGSQEPVESETGFCDKAPVTCQTDADCPQYLKCTASSEMPCWADSSGDSGCLPPDANAPKYCAYAPIECLADADCPSNFACTEEPASCPPIACMPGDECTPPACEPSGKKFCEPGEINCQADADCPQGWSCIGMETDCAVAPVGPGPTADASKAPDQPDCTPEVRKLCSPPGFSSVGEYKESADQAAATGNPSNAPAAPAEEDGGCSLPPRPVSGAGASALLFLAAAWLARSRRR